MDIKGLDRVVILVRDMDKALQVFSDKFGMDFLELDKNIAQREGMRSCVCHKTHIHLISPVLPLPPNAPPPIVKNAELLKENEFVFLALTFKVDDPFAAQEELKKQGIRFIEHHYAKSHDYVSLGMDNFEEAIFHDQDTFGVVLGLANHVSSPCQADKKTQSDILVTGLDRIIFMVRDMEKALAFFSGKLGLKFRETAPEVQLHAGNRGLVCHNVHLHLVQPNNPLPPTVPPPLKIASELLKKKEAMIMLLIFKVNDAKKESAKAANSGLSVIRSWEDDHDYAAVGMDDLYEYLFDPKDTLGIPICVSTWKSV